MSLYNHDIFVTHVKSGRHNCNIFYCESDVNPSTFPCTCYALCLKGPCGMTFNLVFNFVMK